MTTPTAMTPSDTPTPKSASHALLDRLLLISLAKNRESGRIIADRIEELERENAELRAEVERLKAYPQDRANYAEGWDDHLRAVRPTLEELHAGVAALRLDRDRLDSGCILLGPAGDQTLYVEQDLRAAIDTAIASSK